MFCPGAAMSYLLCIKLVTWAEDFILFFSVYIYERTERLNTHTRKQYKMLVCVYVCFFMIKFPLLQTGFHPPVTSWKVEVALHTCGSARRMSKQATCHFLFSSFPPHVFHFPSCSLLHIIHLPRSSSSYLRCTSLSRYSLVHSWMVFWLQLSQCS